jgi:signal transduction histidine kinase
VVQSLRHIALSSQRAAHAVNQLLALARAEDTGQAMRRVPADLADITRAVVLDFVPRALDRGIDLGYEGPGALDEDSGADSFFPLSDTPADDDLLHDDTKGPEGRDADAARALPRPPAGTGVPAGWEAAPPPAPAAPSAQVPRPAAPAASGRILLAEPVLLGEMVRNLVDNALLYTPRGGCVTVRVLPDPFEQVVVLQVEDTGPGIELAERERVFQPFYRTLGTQVEGSGLGLAIVKEIAQRHGGEVIVQDARPRASIASMAGAGRGGSPTTPGQGPGALFTVRLPLSTLPAAAPPPVPPKPWE